MKNLKIKNGVGLVFVSFLILLGFYACKKEGIDQNQKSIGTKYQSSVTTGRSTGRSLSDSVIARIGAKHNEVMHNLLAQVGLDSTNVKNKMKVAALSYTDPYIDSVFSDRMLAMDSVINYSEEYLIGYTSASVYSMMQEIKSYLITMPNFPVLQTNLNSYRAYAISNFTGHDLDVSLVFIEVVKKSSKFWMPVSQGGLGTGSAYILNFYDYNNMEYAPINWGQIAYADGKGAAGSLLRTWYLAGFGPLSWGAIIGAIGWGAAWASGFTILDQLMD